jgi:hypothetical protein
MLVSWSSFLSGAFRRLGKREKSIVEMPAVDPLGRAGESADRRPRTADGIFNYSIIGNGDE